MIEKYGRTDLGTGTLCNKTAGGDGIVDWSDEFRSMMVAIRNTPEYKETQRINAVEQWNDPEAREALSHVLKTKWETDSAFVEHMLSSLQSTQVRETHKKITAEHWKDPVFREKVLAYIQSDENKTRQQELARALWQNPEFRAKQQQTRDENGTNKIISEKHKALWQDPEYKSKQAINRKTKWQEPEYVQKVMDGCNNPDVIEKRKLIAQYRRKYVADTSYTGSIAKITKHMINSYYNTDF